IAHFVPARLFDAREDRLGGHPGLHREARAGFKSAGNRGEELASVGGIEIAEAVPETKRAVEFLAPGEVSHVGDNPCCGKRPARGAGLLDELLTQVDPGDAVAAPCELNRVTAVATRHIEEVRRL